MPRKRKTLPPNYDAPFPARLRSLLDEKNLTQQALADEVEVKRQTVSSYCDGSASPSLEMLVRIATYLEASTDYLLGLSDVRSLNADIQQVCDYTGLTEEAVYIIHQSSVWGIPDVLSRIIDNEAFALASIDLSSAAYNYSLPVPELHDGDIVEVDDAIQLLQKHGYVISDHTKYADYLLESAKKKFSNLLDEVIKES